MSTAGQFDAWPETSTLLRHQPAAALHLGVQGERTGGGKNTFDPWTRRPVPLHPRINGSLPQPPPSAFPGDSTALMSASAAMPAPLQAPTQTLMPTYKSAHARAHTRTKPISNNWTEMKRLDNQNSRMTGTKVGPQWRIPPLPGLSETVPRPLDQASTASDLSHLLALEQHPVVGMSDDVFRKPSHYEHYDTRVKKADSPPEDLELLEIVDPQCLMRLSRNSEVAARDKMLKTQESYRLHCLRPRALAQSKERALLLSQGRIDPLQALAESQLSLAGVDPIEARDFVMMAEYAGEITNYLRQCEDRLMVMYNPSLAVPGAVDAATRCRVVDRLVHIHSQYRFCPETLFNAVNIMDRFLSVQDVGLEKLQLLMITSFFLASKYEETAYPRLKDVVRDTRGACTDEQIMQMELVVLKTLHFDVSRYASPYPFLRRISKADDYDIHTRTLAKFFAELTLTDTHFALVRPHTVAALSMYLACRMLARSWDSAFVYYSDHVEEQLIPAANKLLAQLVHPEVLTLHVFWKYTSRRFYRASLFARDWACRHART